MNNFLGTIKQTEDPRSGYKDWHGSFELAKGGYIEMGGPYQFLAQNADYIKTEDFY